MVQRYDAQSCDHREGTEHVVRKMFRIRCERVAFKACCGLAKRPCPQKINDNGDYQHKERPDGNNRSAGMEKNSVKSVVRDQNRGSGQKSHACQGAEVLCSFVAVRMIT